MCGAFQGHAGPLGALLARERRSCAGRSAATQALPTRARDVWRGGGRFGAVQRITVFTDGACSGNPGPGGWGWAVAPDGEPRSAGGERTTTNQRMELYAVLDAIRVLGADGSPIDVVSDSTYVVNCFRDRWFDGWRRRGWKNSKGQPVANDDLWRPLIELVEAGDVSFRWVKGHSGDPMNDLVDGLAVAAIPR